jgi:hypothetical protein
MDKKYVLFRGDVWILLRKDHFGDESIWHIQADHPHAIWMRYVDASLCTELDPALNVLFERKENG